MKHLIVIGISILLATSAYSQNIREALKTIPLTGEIFPGLTEENLSQLLSDSLQSPIPYTLGTFRIEAQDENYLTIKTSGAGTIEFKLLPLINNSQIIGVIKTVCANACDSHIRFYSPDWNLLNHETLLSNYLIALFIEREKSDNQSGEALRILSMSPLSFSFEKGSYNLNVKLNYKEYIPQEIIKDFSPFIRQDSITLHWNKTAFRQ